MKNKTINLAVLISGSGRTLQNFIHLIAKGDLPARISVVIASNPTRFVWHGEQPSFSSAVGRTKGSLIQVNLTANTDLRSVEEFRNLVIRQAGDRLVRLRDVADVVLGGGLRFRSAV